MSRTLLVTGATGLVGANACLIAAEHGDAVRALVRPGTDVAFLTAIGVEPVFGDVTDPDSVLRAAQGVDGVVHTAALLGTPANTYTWEQFVAVNHVGTVNVLDAAGNVGARTVVLTTNALFKATRAPLSEESPLLDDVPQGYGYFRSKRAGYVAAMQRAAAGQHVVAVVPGAIYGPAPSGRRVLDPTSFNGTLLEAYRGELTRYPRVPFSWVTGEDVARVSLLALDRGRSGRRYLAVGDPRDRVTVAEFCNRGLELAGSPHRVEDIDVDRGDEDLAREFKGMEVMSRWNWPTPLVDPARTHAELVHQPTRFEVGIRATVDWLRALGELS